MGLNEFPAPELQPETGGDAALDRHALRTLSLLTGGRHQDHSGAVPVLHDGFGAGGTPGCGGAVFLRRRPHVSVDWSHRLHGFPSSRRTNLAGYDWLCRGGGVSGAVVLAQTGYLQDRWYHLGN